MGKVQQMIGEIGIQEVSGGDSCKGRKIYLYSLGKETVVYRLMCQLEEKYGLIMQNMPALLEDKKNKSHFRIIFRIVKHDIHPTQEKAKASKIAVYTAPY